MAYFTFAHASEYILVVNEKSMKPVEPVLKEGYAVQIGAFSKKENATKWMEKGNKLGFAMYLEQSNNLYRVQTELFETKEEAKKAESKLKKAGLKTFIVKAKRWVTEEASDNVAEPVNPEKPEGQEKQEESALPPVSEEKSVETLAKEVISGKWGNGSERKERLTKAGYDYRKVQDKVNEMLR